MPNPNLGLPRQIARSRFLRLFAYSCGSAVVLAACSSGTAGSSAGDSATGNSTTPAVNSSTSAPAASGPALTVGTEATYPPFSFRDLQSGEIVGYDVDVAREVAKRLGREIEFVPTPWKSMLASLDAKRFDFVANQVSVSPERAQQYAFSEPYTVSGIVVLVNNDNPKNIQGVADIKGKTVGTTQGSNYAEAAEKAGANLKYYQGIAQVLTDLQQNRIDAALNDRFYALTELKKTNYKVKAVGEPFDETQSAFAFQKDNVQLRDDVNRVLSEIKQDGTLTKISEKWFGEDVSS
ncbi:transporter substrate-binding domain-containing protein [Leptolyngbya sp. FACHB-261]|uniref:transporter substrate-binding domain-containing protein n=1 Tax=Leptolyngbya sp. FACHB-261 TaxID=2692806 RepID=UPI001682362B|nr:transporter substrate-binding domain-containing protein [Leptolyngbya sp. FACHB-261]MBD2104478.1 transporter substrate-binding domain-containing protein [Leptolyngbya sp. FACHB-261]